MEVDKRHFLVVRWYRMWYHINMSKINKKIMAMKNNPKGDWVIEDLKSLADKHGIVYRQPGTSHVTFRSLNGRKLTVPAHKPIKAIYIKLFIKFLEGEKNV